MHGSERISVCGWLWERGRKINYTWNDILIFFCAWSGWWFAQIIKILRRLFFSPILVNRAIDMWHLMKRFFMFMLCVDEMSFFLFFLLSSLLCIHHFFSRFFFRFCLWSSCGKHANGTHWRIHWSERFTFGGISIIIIYAV